MLINSKKKIRLVLYLVLIVPFFVLNCSGIRSEIGQGQLNPSSDSTSSSDIVDNSSSSTSNTSSSDVSSDSSSDLPTTSDNTAIANDPSTSNLQQDTSQSTSSTFTDYTTITSLNFNPDNLNVVDLYIDEYRFNHIIAINLNQTQDETELFSYKHDISNHSPRIQKIYKANINRKLIINDSDKKQSKRYQLQENPSSRSFYLYNGSETVSITSSLIFEGQHVLVYVQGGYSATHSTIINMITHFDNTLYQSTTSIFNNQTYYDVDENNKFIVLFGNITNPHLLGYFYKGDFFQNVQNSNQADMISINVNRVSSSVSDINIIQWTLVHEFIHLLTYSDYIQTSEEQQHQLLETWIDEGLTDTISAHIANIDLQEQYFDTVLNYNSGEGLLVSDTLQSPSIYSLSTTFFEYLRIQYNTNDSFLANILIDRSATDSTGSALIENRFKFLNSTRFNTFNDMLIGWKLANLINSQHATSPFGYQGIYSTNPQQRLSTATSSEIKSGGSVYITTEVENFDASNYLLDDITIFKTHAN